MRFISKLKVVVFAALLAISGIASAQFMYGTGFAGGGVIGSTTNDTAIAGNYGEFLTSTIASGSAVAGGATTVAANITSLALTAGDWDVTANCDYTLTGVTATVYSCALGTVTATQLTQAGGSGVGTDPLVQQAATFGTTVTGTFTQPIPPVRVSLAATTTIFLVTKHTFSAGSFTQFGTLRARRVR